MIDIVSVHAEAVYEINRTAGHRLAIHELCKTTNSVISIRSSKDELSDDEDDDDDDDDDDDNESSSEQEEDEMKIYEVAQLMIDVSHSLGPIRVILPSDDDDDDDDNNNDNNEEVEAGDGVADVVDGDQDEEVIHDEEEQARLIDEEIVNLLGNDNEVLVQNDTHTTNNYRYHESILTVTDGLGKTPLHILCENSCDLNMLKVILGSTRDNTNNPRAPTALSLLLAKDSKGCTPLHYMSYSRQCPFSSLKHVMDYCKPTSHFNEDRTSVLVDPTLCTDEDGETPLHWALDGYMSSRRIKELTRYSLDAIMVNNHKKKTPFDQFVTNFVDTDWTIHDVCGREVWENIQSYLRVIRDNYRDIQHTHHGKRQGKFDPDIWMPLHFIAGSPYDFPPIFTDLALNYCKADLQKFDFNGMLPLHLACGRKIVSSIHHQQHQLQQNKSCKDAVSMKILKKFPRGSLKLVKKTKRLALHLAVEMKMPMSLIAALIKTNPKSLNIPDPVTKLWPYVLASVDNDKSLSVSYALLRADPSVLQLAKRVEQRSDNLTGPIVADDSEYDNHSLRRTVRRLTIRDTL